MDDNYIVVYSGFYGTVCMLVRAPDEETAIDKAKQECPIDEEDPPEIKADLLDHYLSNSDDVQVLARYIE